MDSSKRDFMIIPDVAAGDFPLDFDLDLTEDLDDLDPLLALADRRLPKLQLKKEVLIGQYSLGNVQ